MTLPELFAEILSARAEARKAGASEAELDAIRERLISANRKPNSSQEYVNAWQPTIPVDEKQPEPKHEPINPGRTKGRQGTWHDRF